MKLIDILVEELPKNGGWPKGAAFVAQEEGGGLWSFTSKPQKDCDDEWMDESSSGYHNKVGKLPEASDHDTSAITREQYEAALAAKNDGWIEWGGGECPVEKGTLVDVRWRDGRIDDGIPAKISHDLDSSKRNAISWLHHGNSHDIIAYRLHQPKKSEQVRADAWSAYAGITEPDGEADLNECIGQAPVTTWSGEGLPPVGCECEYSLNGGVTWWRCKIDYIVGTQGVVMLCDTFEGVQYVQFSSYGSLLKFRPARSEAERKRDAATNALMGILGGCGGPHSELKSGEIYDAIAAGEIPGVKLEG